MRRLLPVSWVGKDWRVRGGFLLGGAWVRSSKPEPSGNASPSGSCCVCFPSPDRRGCQAGSHSSGVAWPTGPSGTSLPGKGGRSLPLSMPLCLLPARPYCGVLGGARLRTLLCENLNPGSPSALPTRTTPPTHTTPTALSPGPLLQPQMISGPVLGR